MGRAAAAGEGLAAFAGEKYRDEVPGDEATAAFGFGAGGVAGAGARFHNESRVRCISKEKNLIERFRPECLR